MRSSTSGTRQQPEKSEQPEQSEQPQLPEAAGSRARLRADRAQQLAHDRAVAIQGSPAGTGERDRRPGGDAAPGLEGRHVLGVLQLAQVRDQIARRQPDQVLEPGEGQVVALGHRRQRHPDAQPCGCVDDWIQFVITHDLLRRSPAAASSSSAPPPASALTAHTLTGPANPLPAATASNQMPKPNTDQSRLSAELAATTRPASKM